MKIDFNEAELKEAAEFAYRAIQRGDTGSMYLARGIVQAFFSAQWQSGKARISHVNARNNPDKIVSSRIILTIDPGKCT